MATTTETVQRLPVAVVAALLELDLAKCEFLELVAFGPSSFEGDDKEWRQAEAKARERFTRAFDNTFNVARPHFLGAGKLGSFMMETLS
jgi:hypothetical protein